MATSQHRFVGDFTRQPSQVEDSESGLSATGRKGDRKQVQLIVCQLLQSVHHLFQHLTPGRVKLFLRLTIGFDIEQVAVKIVGSGGKADPLVQVVGQLHLLLGK